MDVATASLLENWIDEAEQCTWFLFEAARAAHKQKRERFQTVADTIDYVRRARVLGFDAAGP